MSTRTILTILAALILCTLAAGGLPNNSTYAQGSTATATASATVTDDDLDPRVEISGTIKSIMQQSVSVWIIVLDDGTQILVNPASQGATNLQVGQAVTIIASVDDEMFVAKIMTTVSATAEPTSAATIPATVPATVVATAPATPAATGVATETASCGGNGGQHPVATRLADAFGVSYDEIMGWHCKGYGFGSIAKAYLLAQKTGKAAAEYLNMRDKGIGWGQIKKESGVDPRALAPGQVINGKKNKDSTTAGATSSTTDDKGNKDAKDNKGNSGKDNKDDKGNKDTKDNKGSSGGKSNGNNGNKGGNSGNSSGGNGGKGGGKK
ncbi:MAG: hypothetical protein IT324_01475 [Anaerolineae bacterium]|nr:hypothetical protein [Anaerolineae bacterium]